MDFTFTSLSLHFHFTSLHFHFTFTKGGGGTRERRKEGEEGVCGAKVCNPKPAIDLLDSVGVEDYQSA